MMRVSRCLMVGSLLVGLSCGVVVLLGGCADSSQSTGTVVEPSKDVQEQTNAMANFMQTKKAEAKK